MSDAIHQLAHGKRANRIRIEGRHTIDCSILRFNDIAHKLKLGIELTALGNDR